MDKVDRLGWAASSNFLVNGRYVGVRSDSGATDAFVRALLRAYVADTDEQPRPNYGLRLTDPAATGRRELSTAFRSSLLTCRSRDPGRAARAMVRAVAHHTGAVPLDGCLVVQAVVLARDGRAVLAPWPLLSRLDRAGAVLARAGVAAADHDIALIDAASGQLVVPEIALEVDWSALAPFAGARSGPTEPPVLAPGRYDIVATTFLMPPEVHEDFPPAVAVVGTARNVVYRGVTPREMVEALAGLFTSARALPVDLIDPARTAARLVGLFDVA